jgi:hypothetical protein
MTARDPDNDRPPGPPPPFDDELIGLDPADPEAAAFADHLTRMRNTQPRFTVEGELAQMGEFANSANRANGHRRLMAVIVVGLILIAVLAAAWGTLTTVFGTFFN